MGYCLPHSGEPTLLLRLVKQHAEDSSAANAVLVVDHLRRHELLHVECELLGTCVEHERLPVLRPLVLLQKFQQRVAATGSTRRLTDHA